MNRTEIIAKVMFHISEASKLIGLLNKDTGPSKNLGAVAESALGKDASPDDIVPDDVGCAESVSNIIRELIPDFPIITGTWTLWDKMENDERFVNVTEPQPGDIIISPTGTLRNAPFIGHVGIMLDNYKIMSATSANGLWEQNYNLDSWNAI